MTPMSENYLYEIGKIYPELFRIEGIINDVDVSSFNVLNDCHDLENFADEDNCTVPRVEPEEILNYVRQQDLRMASVVDPIIQGDSINDFDQTERIRRAIDQNFVLEDDIRERIQSPFSCLDVWKLVFVGMHIEAKTNVEEAMTSATQRGLDPEVALREFMDCLLYTF